MWRGRGRTEAAAVLEGAQRGRQRKEDFGFLNGLAAVIGGPAIHGIQPLSGRLPAGDHDYGSRIVGGHHPPDAFGSQPVGVAEDGIGGRRGRHHGMLMGFQDARQLGQRLAGKVDQQNFRHLWTYRRFCGKC